jgi:hypothetical protein
LFSQLVEVIKIKKQIVIVKPIKLLFIFFFLCAKDNKSFI